jgi:hypothetical protein
LTAGFRVHTHDADLGRLKISMLTPWEGLTDRDGDLIFWGGIPETNFSRSLGPFKAKLKKMPPDQAAKVWIKAMDPVTNQNIIRG